MVIWLIGISGAGKTTLGNALVAHYRAQGRQSYLIDGDAVRSFFDNDLGYSRQERMENIRRIILAAHVCDENGVVTVVANISPFEELRRFARQKIRGYHEIYLKRDVRLSRARDVKGVYQAHGDSEMVGLGQAFDEPEHPDLTIDTGSCTEAEALARILALLEGVL